VAGVRTSAIDKLHGVASTFEVARVSASTSATPPNVNIQRRRLIADMWKSSILLAAALAGSSQALHFFMDGAVQKCFYEELPKDTLVVGMLAFTLDCTLLRPRV